ncbi:hypothetical protein [Nostoc sp.]|uniref:hypothetical protein n=1 Tax=Nostoc sp. TaxID=1180 RepID=UPI002FFB2D03
MVGFLFCGWLMSCCRAVAVSGSLPLPVGKKTVWGWGDGVIKECHESRERSHYHRSKETK